MSDKLIPDDIDACSVVVVGGGPDPETVIVHCIDHDVHFTLMGDHP